MTNQDKRQQLERLEELVGEANYILQGGPPGDGLDPIAYRIGQCERMIGDQLVRLKLHGAGQCG